MKNIAILGSTGSIGTQTLDIVDQNKEDLQVVALAAGSNITLLEKQARKYRPTLVAVWDQARTGKGNLLELAVEAAKGHRDLCCIRHGRTFGSSDLSGIRDLSDGYRWHAWHPSDDRGDRGRKGYCTCQ